MKSLKESLFGDNITTDVPVNFDFVVDYVRDKIQKANKKGIDVNMDLNNRGDYEVEFNSHLFNTQNLNEQTRVKFVIAHVNDTVGIKPYIIFGVDKTFVWRVWNRLQLVSETKGITFKSVWDDQPDKLIKTIDGLFEGFEKIHKDKQPIITNPRQTTINNIGLALFYNKMKRCFKYPDLQKID